jgi:MFS family permease
LNRIFDGIGRPFFGWLSDQIGREYTMALAFLIGAGALFTLSRSGSNQLQCLGGAAGTVRVEAHARGILPGAGLPSSLRASRDKAQEFHVSTDVDPKGSQATAQMAGMTWKYDFVANKRLCFAKAIIYGIPREQ